MNARGRAALLLLALVVFCLPAGAQQVPVQPSRPAPAADTLPADTAAQRRAAARAEPDSILEALLRLEGFIATEYAGETAVFQAGERVLRLRGEAEVVRQGDRLTADSIIYREQNRIAEAYGSPKVTSANQQAEGLEGQVMFYDLDRQRATVVQGRTQFSQGATWFVQGDVTAEAAQRFYTTAGIFTTDDRPEPKYHFQSDKILMVRDRIIVARPARLYFENVPVMWLPFLVQDLTRGRRSGLLTPRFGVNDIVRTSSGYTREISNLGFYWAINDYMDAQIAGGWRSGVATSLLGSTQYRWRRRFLDGNFNFQRFWEESGSRQFVLSSSNRWKPDERTNIAVTGNYATSSRFVRETSTDPREVRQDLRSDLSLGRRFDWGNVNFGARRSQSVLDDRVDMTLPDVGIVLNPITLFREPLPEQARWYNNATLTLSGTGSRAITTGIANFERGTQDVERTNASLNQSLNIGNLSWSSTGLLNRSILAELVGDTVMPRRDDDQGNWSTNLSYRQRLVGNTAISPNLGISQEYRRNLRSGGEYVGGPRRLNFGAGLSPDLYGFFPGVGPYTVIRHNLRPSMSYSYSPQVEQTALQDTVYGTFSGRAQNRVSLSLSQTWEAKRRTPSPPAREPAAGAAGDTLGGDTLVVGVGTPPVTPQQAEKVQLLSINTSALEYDFLRAQEGMSGFVTQRVSNSIRSDFLRGLNLDFSHELFDPTGLDTDARGRGELGRFAPYLSSFNTSFSFGQGSAAFQFLGRILGRTEESIPPPGATVPDAPLPSEREEQLDDGGDLFGARRPGSESFTGNPRGVGSGPWNVSLSYSLLRSRASGTGTGAGGGFGPSESQNVVASINFSPTRNWAVNWSTSYSITDGQFGEHRLNLRRDLYRWQANIDFTRTAYGNTAFYFTVHLLDLQDLKVDYRERNIGRERAF
ncbi:MAG TPA: putative LPS assembly protein LptD [Longimicrobiaceae bacterium]|nr:putative LPS assembly protein LptD [Longimicrobiaceae bacterium]